VYSDETVNAIPNLHKSVDPFGLGLLLKLLPQKGSSRFLGTLTLAIFGNRYIHFTLWLLILGHPIPDWYPDKDSERIQS